VLGIVGCRFWYDWPIGSAADLHLHTSNRLERLFAELAGIVSESLGSFLHRGIVLVQTVFAKVRIQHFPRGEELQL
jgi:hypothetical protein